jgi:hypothetical protein
MTKKVDKTFHEREIWAVKKLARRALSLLLALNPKVYLIYQNANPPRVRAAGGVGRRS